VKEAALQGLAIGGDLDRVLEVAKTEKDLDLRAAAIRFVGVFGGPARSDVLLEIYRDGGEPRVREAALEALFTQGNGVPLLISFAQTHRSREVRKQAMFWLGQSQNPRALSFFEEVLAR
jgi:hypothetical protein